MTEQAKALGADELRRSIRKFRKQLKLSQAELASLAGLAQHTLSRFEMGKRNLSQDALNRVGDAIAKALDKKKLEVTVAAAEMNAAHEDVEKLIKMTESDA